MDGRSPAFPSTSWSSTRLWCSARWPRSARSRTSAAALPRPAAVADHRAGGDRRRVDLGGVPHRRRTSSTATGSPTSRARRARTSRPTRTTPAPCGGSPRASGSSPLAATYYYHDREGTARSSWARWSRSAPWPRWCGWASPATPAPARSGARPPTRTYPAGSLTRYPRPPVSSGRPRSTPCTAGSGSVPVTVNATPAEDGQPRRRAGRGEHVQHRRERLLRHLDLDRAHRAHSRASRPDPAPRAAPLGQVPVVSGRRRRRAEACVSERHRPSPRPASRAARWSSTRGTVSSMARWWPAGCSPARCPSRTSPRTRRPGLDPEADAGVAGRDLTALADARRPARRTRSAVAGRRRRCRTPWRAARRAPLSAPRRRG